MNYNVDELIVLFCWIYKYVNDNSLENFAELYFLLGNNETFNINRDLVLFLLHKDIQCDKILNYDKMLKNHTIKFNDFILNLRQKYIIVNLNYKVKFSLEKTQKIVELNFSNINNEIQNVYVFDGENFLFNDCKIEKKNFNSFKVSFKVSEKLINICDCYGFDDEFFVYYVFFYLLNKKKCVSFLNAINGFENNIENNLSSEQNDLFSF